MFDRLKNVLLNYPSGFTLIAQGGSLVALTLTPNGVTGCHHYRGLKILKCAARESLNSWENHFFGPSP